MLTSMSKSKRSLLFFVLCLADSIAVADLIITPTISLLFTTFPNETGYMNFIISGCIVVSIFATPLMGRLSRTFNHKTLLIIGAAIGTVSGLLTIFVLDAFVLAVARGLMQLAYAFTRPSTLVYVTAMYDDVRERTKMMGLYQGIQTGFGALFSFTSGILAETSLQLAYSLNLLIPVYLIMLILFVPKIMDPMTVQADTKKEKVSVGGLGKLYWMAAAIYGIFYSTSLTGSYYLSVYVTENSLGSSALAGTLSTMMTGAGFVMGFIFGPLFKKLGKGFVIGMMALCSGMYALMWAMPSFVSLILGCLAIGTTGTVYLSFNSSFLPILVPKERVTDSLAFMTTLALVGCTVLSYFITGMMGLLNIQLIANYYIVPAIIMGICTVATVFIFNSKAAKEVYI